MNSFQWGLTSQPDDCMTPQMPAAFNELGKASFCYRAPTTGNNLQNNFKLPSFLSTGHFKSLNTLLFTCRCSCFSWPAYFLRAYFYYCAGFIVFCLTFIPEFSVACVAVSISGHLFGFYCDFVSCHFFMYLHHFFLLFLLNHNIDWFSIFFPTIVQWHKIQAALLMISLSLLPPPDKKCKTNIQYAVDNDLTSQVYIEGEMNNKTKPTPKYMPSLLLTGSTSNKNNSFCSEFYGQLGYPVVSFLNFFK